MTEPRKSWIKRLQERWQLATVKDAVIVLIVFALTGTTIVFIKPYILGLFTESGQIPLWFTVLYYILILPVYNLILLIYGAIFGKFDFFWKFEKKFFNRIFRSKSKKNL